MSLLFVANLSQAIQQCESVFTSPASRGHNDFPAPTDLIPATEDLECFNFFGFIPFCSPNDDYVDGDFNYLNGSFSNESFLSPSERTTRLYFNNLTLSNAQINENGNPENLIIYVRGSFNLAGQSRINAMVYVAGAARISGQAQINGGLAAGDDLRITGQARVTRIESAVNDANFNGMCFNSQNPEPEPEPEASGIRFGVTDTDTVGSVQQVTFDTAFPAETKPLVFITPTINAQTPETDGPSSIKLISVTNTGFSWKQIAAPMKNENSALTPQPMKNVNWVALTPGEHNIGSQKLVAGMANFNNAFDFNNNTGMPSSPWFSPPVPASFSLAMSQIQTDRNARCWLSSVSTVETVNGLSRLNLSLDPSLVYDRNSQGQRACPGTSQTVLNNEDVAYLVFDATSGSESAILNGAVTRFQFGQGLNRPEVPRGQSLTEQCQHVNTLDGFTDIPALVGSKSRRQGVDGGWFRQCELSQNHVSMVIDEDQYDRPTNDRRHLAETFDYVAFQKVTNDTEVLHHFEFLYSDVENTCEANDIQFRACANESCSKKYSLPLAINLQPDNINRGQEEGWYHNNIRISPNNFQLAGGETNFDIKYFRGRSIRLDATTISTPVLSQTVCGTNSASATAEQCRIRFARSGLQLDFPNTYSNKPQTGTIRVIRNCRADNRFRNTTNWIVSRVSYSESSVPQDRALFSYSGGFAEEGLSYKSIRFNSNAEAEVEFLYPESGKLSLDSFLWFDRDLTSSNDVTFVPYGLCLTAQDNAAKCSTNDANCSVYKRAGDNFSLSIQAKAWQLNSTSICSNPNVDNYQTEAGDLPIQLTHDIVAPSDGNEGVLNMGQPADVKGSNPSEYVYKQGTNNIMSRRLSESGIFEITASANSYLGVTDLPIQSGFVGNLGRFVPARFDVENVSTFNSCSAGRFTYLGQPFSNTFNILATNLQGNVTQNYRGAFAKATGIINADDNNSNILTQRLVADDSATSNAIPSTELVFDNGVASVELSPLLLRNSYPQTLAAPVNIDELRLALTLIDNDGGFAQQAPLNMTVGQSTCLLNSAACDATRIDSANLSLKLGRIIVQPSMITGSATSNEVLSAKIYSQVWNGNDFINFSTDSCTVLEHAGLTESQPYNPPLDQGQQINRTFASGTTAPLVQGIATLNWQNIGGYKGIVTDKLAVPDYLKWHWENDHNLLFPEASANYESQTKGHDRIIYWREIN